VVLVALAASEELAASVALAVRAVSAALVVPVVRDDPVVSVALEGLAELVDPVARDARAVLVVLAVRVALVVREAVALQRSPLGVAG
jgi:hypothetical protein